MHRRDPRPTGHALLALLLCLTHCANVCGLESSYQLGLDDGAQGAQSTASGTGGASGTGAPSVVTTSGAGGGAASCGDGVLAFGEQCEDGGTTSGDGCSDSCTLEGTPESCPSGVTVLLGSSPVGIYGTTAGMSADVAACSGAGPDAIYEIVPAASTTVTVELSPSFEAVLQVRAACLSTNGNCSIGSNMIGVPYSATTLMPFYVHVGGFTPADAGIFVLTITP